MADAHLPPAPRRRFAEALALGARDPERLFDEHVAARLEHLARELRMQVRRREDVDDVEPLRLDHPGEVGVGPRDPLRRREAFGAHEAHVADRDHLDAGDPGQGRVMVVGDVAGPEETDPHLRALRACCGRSSSGHGDVG